jgi:hypothetical protein
MRFLLPLFSLGLHRLSKSQIENKTVPDIPKAYLVAEN